QKLKFLPLRRYNLTLNLLSRSHDWIASGRQIAINGHIKFNLTIPLQQLNGLETLVIIMVANKYAFLQITRRRFLNEWEAFKKVISRRNIRRRITIPLTLSNLKLLRRITRTKNILHRNFTRRQVAIQNSVASNIGISQSTFSVKVLNLFSRSRRKDRKSGSAGMPRPISYAVFCLKKKKRNDGTYSRLDVNCGDRATVPGTHTVKLAGSPLLTIALAYKSSSSC